MCGFWICAIWILTASKLDDYWSPAGARQAPFAEPAPARRPLRLRGPGGKQLASPSDIRAQLRAAIAYCDSRPSILIERPRTYSGCCMIACFRISQPHQVQSWPIKGPNADGGNPEVAVAPGLQNPIAGHSGAITAVASGSVATEALSGQQRGRLGHKGPSRGARCQ